MLNRFNLLALLLFAILFIHCADKPVESSGSDNKPFVEITSPLNYGTVIDKATISVNAFDDSGISRVEFYIDGAFVESVTTQPFVYNWDASDSEFGSSHVLLAKAFDSDGNVANSSPVTVAVKHFKPKNVTAAYINNDSLKLSWEDLCDFESGFEVEMSTDGQNFSIFRQNIPANTTSIYIDVSNNTNDFLYYRVLSYYNAEYSDYSDTAGVVNQTIDVWEIRSVGQDSHNIAISLSVNPTINGEPLSSGDIIGVFYNYNGILFCGGKSIWTGTETIGITAYGDESATTQKDGFEYGEEFVWRIKRISDGQEFDAVATYKSGTSYFVTNGTTLLETLHAN